MVMNSAANKYEIRGKGGVYESRNERRKDEMEEGREKGAMEGVNEGNEAGMMTHYRSHRDNINR